MNPNGRHRVYLSFQDRYGWQCQFLEADLKTPLPKRLHFTSPDKINDLVERGSGLRDQESRLSESDRGAVQETKDLIF
jgi:hypothetical protein